MGDSYSIFSVIWQVSLHFPSPNRTPLLFLKAVSDGQTAGLKLFELKTDPSCVQNRYIPSNMD